MVQSPPLPLARIVDGICKLFGLSPSSSTEALHEKYSAGAVGWENEDDSDTEDLCTYGYDDVRPGRGGEGGVSGRWMGKAKGGARILARVISRLGGARDGLEIDSDNGCGLRQMTREGRNEIDGPCQEGTKRDNIYMGPALEEEGGRVVVGCAQRDQRQKKGEERRRSATFGGRTAQIRGAMAHALPSGSMESSRIDETSGSDAHPALVVSKAGQSLVPQSFPDSRHPLPAAPLSLHSHGDMPVYGEDCGSDIEEYTYGYDPLPAPAATLARRLLGLDGAGKDGSSLLASVPLAPAFQPAMQLAQVGRIWRRGGGETRSPEQDQKGARESP